MKSLPKISIITPTLNQGQFIEQTINSILSQNYPNLEYIIIDGGSTDNTIEIIKKYEKQITCWISEPDKGQSDAINKGLKLITGDIFNWINSDDYYEPNALWTIARTFTENPEVEVVCGCENVFENNNEIVSINYGSTICPNIADTILTAHIDQPSTFWRVDVVKRIGLLSNKYNYLMDADWWVRYLLLHGQKSILNISDKLVNFRLHQSSKTVQFIDKFKIERIKLNCSVAIFCSVPDFIINEMKLQNNTSEQIEIPVLQNKQSNKKIKNLMLARYCFDYYGKFYFQHRFTESRIALLKYLKYGKLIINLNLLKIILKLFIIPDFILKKIIKHN